MTVYRHCEYHSFCTVQVVPATHVAGTIQPAPPHWPHLGMEGVRVDVEEVDVRGDVLLLVVVVVVVAGTTDVFVIGREELDTDLMIAEETALAVLVEEATLTRVVDDDLTTVTLEIGDGLEETAMPFADV